MAVGRDPLFFGRFEPLLFRAERIPVSPEALDDLLSRRAGEVTAVLVEPLVQAAGGMRMHSCDTLRELHAVAGRHGVLFIVDEVMTAGRTGTFWAHSQADVVPDLICAAKTLAGGVLPLAATLASPAIVAAFDTADRAKTFFHGHSFTAHPLACAVAVENLRIMADGEWRRQSERMHRRWREAVPALAELPGVSDVRVRGTVLALDVGTGGYLADSGRRMRAAAIETGVLLRPLGNVLYTLPPLDTSDASLDRIVDAMRAAIGAAGAT
jgi:adenosylmethionine-8-amino-7-oxononanoate aminotransferase